jgi:hypothetical protein
MPDQKSTGPGTQVGLLANLGIEGRERRIRRRREPSVSENVSTMGTSNESKAKTLARDQALVVGIPKRMGSAQFLVNEQTLTAAAVVTMLQGRVTAATNAATSKAAYSAAVKAADAAESATAATVSGVVETIYVAFGNDAAALADFGLPVRKRAVLTPAQRIAAAAKAKATRAARHTMGPKQKATVTGNVTGVTITPVVSTSSTTSASSVATAPASATATSTSSVAAAGQPTVGTAAAAGASGSTAHA